MNNGVEILLKDGTREWIDPVVSREVVDGVLRINNGAHTYEYKYDQVYSETPYTVEEKEQ